MVNPKTEHVLLQTQIGPGLVTKSQVVRYDALERDRANAHPPRDVVWQQADSQQGPFRTVVPLDDFPQFYLDIPALYWRAA